MRKTRILNLYAGIGGNRKLWGDDHMITAVEHDPQIAKIYKDHFPNDRVLVEDAHEYLLKHFEEYDFIWSSPPCPTHSRARLMGTWMSEKKNGTVSRQNDPVYPEMGLYQEILLLQTYARGKWCVENVVSYYDPLIPAREFGNHFFWSNFHFTAPQTEPREHMSSIDKLAERKGFDLSGYKGIDKRTILRNCVEPELGLHILQCAFEPETKMLFAL